MAKTKRRQSKGHEGLNWDTKYLHELIEQIPSKIQDDNISLFLDGTTQYQIISVYHSRTKSTDVVRVRFPGKRFGKQGYVNFCIKIYRDLSDLNRNNIRRETDIPRMLGEDIDHLANIHLVDSKKDRFTYIMDDLGPKTLGRFYRNLDTKEIATLKNLFQNKDQGYKVKLNEDQIILESLMRLGFVLKEHGSSDQWFLDLRKEDWQKSSLVEERFELKNGILVPKYQFLNEKLDAFCSALDAIVDFDWAAQNRIDEIEQLGFPIDSVRGRVNRWFENWNYVEEISGLKTDEKEMSTLKKLYNQIFASLETKFDGGPIIGNSKPLNFIFAPVMTEKGLENIATIIDLYRVKIGSPRVLRDAVSLLSVGQLTCDISPEEHDFYWEYLKDKLTNDSAFRPHEARSLLGEFEDYGDRLKVDRLGAYYMSACEDVVKRNTVPSGHVRKQAEFVIDAGSKLFDMIVNNGFDDNFKNHFVPYLHLGEEFKEFVATYLPPEYSKKLEKHNDNLQQYLGKQTKEDVTPG